MKKGFNLLLLVLVAACVASLWWAQGRPFPGRTPEPPVRPVEEREVSGDPELSAIHLRILNATGTSGLAGQFAMLIPRLNCVIQGLGNAPTWTGTRSMLINRRLPDGRAQELAALLGNLPVLKEWDGRTDEDAVLILGEDHVQVRQAIALAIER